MGILLVVVLFSLLQSSMGAYPSGCTGVCRQAGTGLLHGNSSGSDIIFFPWTDSNAKMPLVMRLKEKHSFWCRLYPRFCDSPVPSSSQKPCVDGRAGPYECKNVDLLTMISLEDLGSYGKGNDIWGWTDPKTGREYAIVGCSDGTSFVDVTVPTAPVVLGFLPTETTTSSWRDMKVYNNHAFIVSEAEDHGVQIFDLTRLRNMKSFSGNLKRDAHYDSIGSAHNIVGNEETGFMYAVGTQFCKSGLHIIDVREPLKPKFKGCFSEDGYVHDAQCVIYHGPDKDYKGREICFCYNEDTLTIVDVENKDDIKMVSRIGYIGSCYTHQGWLNEEHTHLLMNDELDELQGFTEKTRSMVWNVKKLKKPILVESLYSTERAIDHNLYIKGNLAYETNYCAGLRIIDIQGMQDEAGSLKEVGFFDVAPDCKRPIFSGSWSNYPFFDSGTIIVQSIERGLFILKFNDPTLQEANPYPPKKRARPNNV